MRLTTTLPIITIFLLSCGTKKNAIEKSDQRLLFFSTRTVMEMESLIESDSLYRSIYSEKFNVSTDTIRYDKGEIYISYLSIVNGCADYSGEIQFKGDSIMLQLINKRDYVCTEQRCDRITFKIKNEDNRVYKIKKW